MLSTTDEGCGGSRAYNACYNALVNIFDCIYLLHEVRYLLPRPTVSTLVKTLIVSFLVTAVTIEPRWIVLNEVDDTIVKTCTHSPVEPFLYSWTKLIDIETAHERRVKVGKLVLIAIVDCGNDTASLWKNFACQFTVQRQVHHRLKNFRTGTVQLIKKENDWLAVNRKPIRRSEVGLRCHISICVFRFYLGGKADDVARVTHLTQEECHHLHSLTLEIAGEDF